MNHKLVIPLVLLALLLFSGVVSASVAEAPAIDWNVTGGGGAVAIHGTLAIESTIGQPVVGEIGTDGAALCTGYWCGALASYRVYLPLALRGT